MDIHDFPATARNLFWVTMVKMVVIMLVVTMFFLLSDLHGAFTPDWMTGQ